MSESIHGSKAVDTMGDNLEQWEWDMVFGGDASDSLRQRAERQPDYAAQRAAWARSQQDESRLRRALFRVNCPPTLKLGEFHLNMLADDEAAGLQGHLSHCPHCPAELASLAETLESPLERHPEREGVRDRLKRVYLRLQRSSPGAGTPAPALRGRSRSVRYASGPFMLSLTHRESEDGIHLLGSLLNTTEPGTVTLREGNQIVGSAPLTAAATFVMPEIPEGQYDLVITLPSYELVVADLTLAA